jgi:hypothetical protein
MSLYWFKKQIKTLMKPSGGTTQGMTLTFEHSSLGGILHLSNFSGL